MLAATVVRLVTTVELDGEDGDTGYSVSARLVAEVDDGRRVTLLDDRGWSESGPPGVWSYTDAAEIADTARTVVGPDEPWGGMTYEQAERNHWSFLARAAAAGGLVTSGDVLRALPHDVVIGERLRSRLA